MATITNDFGPSIAGVLTAPFRLVAGFLWSITEAQKINRQAEFLFSLSDEQLAERGLKRDEIGAYLTRNFGYL